MRIFLAEYSCSTNGAHSTSTFSSRITMRVFNDLENRVPLEESCDELLDQAWDDHTGESLDAKKVK